MREIARIAVGEFTPGSKETELSLRDILCFFCVASNVICHVNGPENEASVWRRPLFELV